MDAKKLTTVITSICAFLFLVMIGPAYTANSTNSSTKKEAVSVKKTTKSVNKNVKSTDKKIKSTKKKVKTSVTNKTKSSTETSVKKLSSDNKINTPKVTSNKKETTTDSKGKTKNTLSNKKEKTSPSKKQSSSLTKKFSGKVNMNKGTVEDLQQIPGIGPVKAKSIIDYRKQHGSFKSAEDLLSVKGIGKGTVDKIKQYLVF